MSGLHSCLWKISGTRCFLSLSLLFFISNITAIFKNKIPPSSKSEMILKELESSHLSSFNVNLTDIFKVTAKYCRKIICKYRQKLLFITSWRFTIMFIIFWDFLMFDQIFLSFRFSYLVFFFYMKSRVCLKYFNTISHLEFMSYIKLRLRWNLCPT